ncbi:MAG: ABC transporter ATP-binding protein [Thermoprotei archaeon]|jgi:oligopeptide/dipeptide ABC transporter ATP-binding protein
MKADNILLKVEDLSINYYTMEGVIKALRNIDLEIKKGESVCIVGESGSGKSTLGLAIARALPSNAKIVSGKILFEGIDILKITNDKLKGYVGKTVSMVFQDPAASLNPLFTIGEQISDVIKNVLGIHDKKQILELAEKMFKKVGLPDPQRISRAYPHELSGGMLQRVSISIALVTNPRLLIADEPTTMLDVTLQAQILELLKELKKELGLSMLFITHNLGVASEIADRIVIMYAGKILEDGPTEEILTNPLHPYTIRLLESIPRVQVKINRLKGIPGTLPDLRNPPSGCPFVNRCDVAKPHCLTNMPKFIEINPGHKVACFNYLGDNHDFTQD